MSTILFSDRLATGSASILSTTTGIDGTAAATTSLYTVPAGKTAIIIGAVVRVTAGNTITVAGTGKVDTTGGLTVFPATAMAGLTAVAKGFCFLNNLLTFPLVPAADVVRMNVTVGITAVSATLAVDLIGYLV